MSSSHSIAAMSHPLAAVRCPASRFLRVPRHTLGNPTIRGRRKLHSQAVVRAVRLEGSAASSQEQLEGMSVGQLRAVAASLGIRGDTKSELIDLILSCPSIPQARPTSSSPASSSAMKDLQRLSLPELREAARKRGLRGSTREDLLLALAMHAGDKPPSNQSVNEPSTFNFPSILPSSAMPPIALRPASSSPSRSPSPPPPAASASAYTSASVPPPPAKAASSSSSSSSSSSAGVSEDAFFAAELELESKGLGELRAMARAVGIRGETKAELIRELMRQRFSSAPTGSPSHAAAASTATPGSANRGKRTPPTPAPPPPTAPSLKAAAARPSAAGSPPASSPPSPPPQPAAAAAAAAAATAAVGGFGLDEAALEAMGLGELRKLARERGIRGDTKAELLQALISSVQAATPDVPVPPKAAPQPAQTPQTVTPSAVLPPLESEKAKTPQALTKVPPPKKPKSSYEDQMDAQSKIISLFLGSGLALAAVPVLLPASEVFKPTPVPSDQAMVTISHETTILLDAILKTQTAALEELRALVPLVSPDLEPEERMKRANEFCKTLPASQRSMETKQFCTKISRVQVE